MYYWRPQTFARVFNCLHTLRNSENFILAEIYFEMCIFFTVRIVTSLPQTWTIPSVHFTNQSRTIFLYIYIGKILLNCFVTCNPYLLKRTLHVHYTSMLKAWATETILLLQGTHQLHYGFTTFLDRSVHDSMSTSNPRPLDFELIKTTRLCAPKYKRFWRGNCRILHCTQSFS